MYNFPSIVKTTDILSPEDLVLEIRNGNLVEAQLPNGVLKLSNDGNFLMFDGQTKTGEHDKRALVISSKSNKQLKEWINNLLPVETEEEKEERLRAEQENELRAAGLEEPCEYSETDDIESYF